MNSHVFKMGKWRIREKIIPKKILFNFLNTCRCCKKKTVLVRNHWVDIFCQKSSKEPEFLKVLEFLTGKT